MGCVESGDEIFNHKMKFVVEPSTQFPVSPQTIKEIKELNIIGLRKEDNGPLIQFLNSMRGLRLENITIRASLLSPSVFQMLSVVMRECPHLRSLTIACVQVVLESMKHIVAGIKECGNLHILCLEFNDIRCREFKILLRELENTSITHLSLDRNKGSMSITNARLMNTVLPRCHLKELVLTGLDMKSRDFIAFRDVIRNTKIEVLSVRDNHLTDEAIIGFEVGGSLGIFDMAHNIDTTDKTNKYLLELYAPKLQMVKLSHFGMSDDIVNSINIPNWSQLRCIDYGWSLGGHREERLRRQMFGNHSWKSRIMVTLASGLQIGRLGVGGVYGRCFCMDLLKMLIKYLN